MIVLLAGPDGSGKSTVTRQLRENVRISSWEHFRAFKRPGAPAPDPHGGNIRSLPLSVAKIVFIFLEQLCRIPVRLHLNKRGHVIVERGWWDQIVDPQRYRLHPKSLALVSALGRLLPRYDVAVLLVASPTEIHNRKPELSVLEIASQIDRWRDAAPRIAREIVTLHTSTSLEVAESCRPLVKLLG